jgi:hypothetical protein
MKLPLLSLSAVVLGLISAQAHAASVYLSLITTPAPGPVSYDLVMDFSPAEATLGGGIDIDLQGPLSLVSFVPSNYFTNVADPAFSGHGTARADNDYEVHFGSFAGLSGKNSLGTFTVNWQSPQPAELRMAINSTFGNFFSVASVQQNVSLIGATLPVPEPSHAAMLLAGVTLLSALLRRRRMAGQGAA